MQLFGEMTNKRVGRVRWSLADVYVSVVT